MSDLVTSSTEVAQPDSDPIELEIQYRVQDTEGGGKYVEINVSVGCVDVSVLTDLPMDGATLGTILAAMPTVIQNVMDNLTPEERDA